MTQCGANVFIRLRPSRKEGNVVVWKNMRSKNQHVCLDRGHVVEEYLFSHVFTDNNADVFTTLNSYSTDARSKSLIESVYSGANETIFAYGQTGSGKTHTIFGSGTPDRATESEEAEFGLVHLCVEELFEQAKSVYCADSTDIEIYMRCFEIFGESLCDLLDPSLGGEDTEVFLKTCRFKYQTVRVENAEICLSILWHTQRARQVGTSSCNVHRSSRSHCVVQFNVYRPYPDGSSGTLTFVDLAGSERATTLDTKLSTVSMRQLNASLASLIRLFRQLQNGDGSELPESERRQSVLNKMVFDYVQPSCGIWLIFCVSTEEMYLEYTTSTLQLATDSQKMCLAPRKYIFVKTEDIPAQDNLSEPPSSGPGPDLTQHTKHSIASRLGTCSEMLARRFDDMVSRCHEYTHAVLQHTGVHAGSGVRHVQAMHSLIEQLPGRESSIDAYLWDQSEASPVRTAWEPDAEDGGKDDIIRELRAQLTEEQRERHNTTLLLHTAQETLETLFAENVTLEEDFMGTIREATEFLGQVEHENSTLKEELRRVTEKETIALPLAKTLRHQMPADSDRYAFANTRSAAVRSHSLSRTASASAFKADVSHAQRTKLGRPLVKGRRRLGENSIKRMEPAQRGNGSLLTPSESVPEDVQNELQRESKRGCQSEPLKLEGELRQFEDTMDERHLFANNSDFLHGEPDQCPSKDGKEAASPFPCEGSITHQEVNNGSLVQSTDQISHLARHSDVNSDKHSTEEPACQRLSLSPTAHSRSPQRTRSLKRIRDAETTRMRNADIARSRGRTRPDDWCSVAIDSSLRMSAANATRDASHRASSGEHARRSSERVRTSSCDGIRARYMSVSANLKRLQRKAMGALQPRG